MSEPRFGESFNIDNTNRLDPFKEMDIFPEAVQFSRDLREHLKGTIETEGWPECPHDLNNLADLFNQGQDTVTNRWLEIAPKILEQKLSEWQSLAPADKEYDQLRQTLADPQEFEKILRLKQMSVLESLREISPEAWRSLILISSERQLAAVTLVRHWSRELTEQDYARLGVSQDELGVLLDTAGLMGKYIDQAYVKQIELADAPGGSSKTKLGEESGAEYVYDIFREKGSDEVDLKTYSEVFPFEWEKIVKGFEMLSRKVADLNAKNRLPESYQGLPGYLDNLASLYSSKEVDLKKLDEQWEALYQATADLVNKGCPLMIVPQGCAGVAGEAGKIDVELRLGFRTKELEAKEKSFDYFVGKTQELIDLNSSKLKKPNKAPQIVMNNQPFAFGPNLYEMTRAEESETHIVSHTNTDIDVAISKELPLLKKIMPNETLDEEAYKDGVITVTLLHELGHSVMSSEDKAVIKRIGRSKAADMLDELKAETVGMKLLNQGLKEKPEIREKARQYFINELGTLSNYLTEKSANDDSNNNKYYYVGLAMISELLDKGVIVENNGVYEVGDHEKGIDVLAGLGDQILEKFYTSDTAKPDQVRQYQKEIKEKGNDARFQKFLKSLK